MAFIPYGRQSIDQNDIDAVVVTLKSDFLTTGPKVAEFETALCGVSGAAYTVAVANGTAALHLAALALLEAGDKVLTTPNTFLATSNAIRYANAEPLFIDIADDGNIDLDLCIAALEKDSSIKALFAVHFSGNPVDQQKLKAIKERFGIIILEDCAHAIGGYEGDVKAGSCRYSDASIFSFHPVKHLTTGEGGAVTTNDEALYKKLLLLRGHGMTREEFAFNDLAVDAKGNANPWYYEMVELGFNYRITDIQCALGLSQLKKLPSFIARRHEIAKAYDDAFASETVVRPLYPFKEGSAYHLYVVQIDFTKLTITKAELFAKMREKAIGLQLHYIPVYKQPYYRNSGYADLCLPKAEAYYDATVSLPMFASLSDEEQRFVIETLLTILHENRA